MNFGLFLFPKQSPFCSLFLLVDCISARPKVQGSGFPLRRTFLGNPKNIRSIFSQFCYFANFCYPSERETLSPQKAKGCYFGKTPSYECRTAQGQRQARRCGDAGYGLGLKISAEARFCSLKLALRKFLILQNCSRLTTAVVEMYLGKIVFFSVSKRSSNIYLACGLSINKYQVCSNVTKIGNTHYTFNFQYIISTSNQTQFSV